jgi:hypothetical protein
VFARFLTFPIFLIATGLPVLLTISLSVEGPAPIDATTRRQQNTSLHGRVREAPHHTMTALTGGTAPSWFRGAIVRA